MAIATRWATATQNCRASGKKLGQINRNMSESCYLEDKDMCSYHSLLVRNHKSKHQPKTLIQMIAFRNKIYQDSDLTVSERALRSLIFEFRGSWFGSEL